MDNLNLVYWLRDTIACIGTLIGMGSAVYLFVRKKTLPAILALVGFVLLGIEPLLEIIFWRILANSSSFDYSSFESLSTAYACINGPTMFLGLVAIALAFFLGFREPKLPPPPPVDEAGTPPLP